MWSTWIQNRFADISTLLCIILVTASVALIPLTPNGQVARVQAGGGLVWVMGGTGTVQQTISAVENGVTAAAQTAFNLKKLSIDPIAQALSRMIIKSMTESIVRWINSGFNGSPAFVTDLKQYMLETADIAAANYLKNDTNLQFLCTPFKVNVRAALAQSYTEQTRTGVPVQCTLGQVSNNIQGFLNGDFSNGGWASWFQITQQPQNTPTGAYLAAKTEMDSRIEATQNQANQELAWGNGFLSMKTCANVTANGTTQQHCTIATPGKVIVGQLDKALGAGQDTLVNVNEVNQLISALFAQLASRAISGASGLLGLSSSGGANNVPGVAAGQSYLNALSNSQPPASSYAGQDPIPAAITTTQQNMTLQHQIISTLTAEQSKYQAAQQNASNSNCTTLTNLQYPSQFNTWLSNAQQTLATDNASLNTLQSLQNQYLTATNPQQQLTIMNQYSQLLSSGQVVNASANAQTQTLISDFIASSAPVSTNPYTVPGFDKTLQNAQTTCGTGSFVR